MAVAQLATVAGVAKDRIELIRLIWTRAAQNPVYKYSSLIISSVQLKMANHLRELLTVPWDL